MARIRISGLEAVNSRLRKLRERVKNQRKVLVGYSAPYASYVHENMQMNHPRGGQAKFLEQPAAEKAAELFDVVALGMKLGLRMDEAQFRAGEVLLAASRDLVPIHTGFLHDSGYVKYE